MSESSPVLVYPFPEWKGKVQAAFSTRKGGVSSGPYAGLNLGFRSGDAISTVQANWEIVKLHCHLENKPLVLPKMVHGDILANADILFNDHHMQALHEPEGADAIFSQRPDGILAVTMADCLTALIFDPVQKTIAAVHAGWRGTKLEILAKTLKYLSAQGLIKPKDTWVAFGPCLRAESLEIGEDVAAQLDARFILRKAGKFYFDMPAANKNQALQLGIPDHQIRDMGGNTMEEPELYFSYRRDGPASGRLAAFISLGTSQD